jgi:hypothetical protein
MSKRMSNYKQLIQAQRYQIEILKKAGRDSEVAERIGINDF